MAQLRDDAPFSEFSRLLTLRDEAEQRAKEVRAQRVFSKPKNSIMRQPLRTSHTTDMARCGGELYLLKFVEALKVDPRRRAGTTGLDLDVWSCKRQCLIRMPTTLGVTSFGSSLAANSIVALLTQSGR